MKLSIYWKQAVQFSKKNWKGLFICAAILISIFLFFNRGRIEGFADDTMIHKQDALNACGPDDACIKHVNESDSVDSCSDSTTNSDSISGSGSTNNSGSTSTQSGNNSDQNATSLEVNPVKALSSWPTSSLQSAPPADAVQPTTTTVASSSEDKSINNIKNTEFKNNGKKENGDPINVGVGSKDFANQEGSYFGTYDKMVAYYSEEGPPAVQSRMVAYRSSAGNIEIALTPDPAMPASSRLQQDIDNPYNTETYGDYRKALMLPGGSLYNFRTDKAGNLL